jgi:hypothetical protein
MTYGSPPHSQAVALKNDDAKNGIADQVCESGGVLPVGGAGKASGTWGRAGAGGAPGDAAGDRAGATRLQNATIQSA